MTFATIPRPVMPPPAGPGTDGHGKTESTGRLARAAVLCLGLMMVGGMTGCATTGDYSQDTLFFSSKKAQKRIAEREQWLDELRAEQSTEVRSQRQNKMRLKENWEEVARRDAELDTMRTEIRKKQNAIAVLDAKILDAQTGPVKPLQALQEERRQLQLELVRLKDHLKRLEKGEF